MQIGSLSATAPYRAPSPARVGQVAPKFAGAPSDRAPSRHTLPPKLYTILSGTQWKAVQARGAEKGRIFNWAATLAQTSDQGALNSFSGWFDMPNYLRRWRETGAQHSHLYKLEQDARADHVKRRNAAHSEAMKQASRKILLERLSETGTRPAGEPVPLLTAVTQRAREITGANPLPPDDAVLLELTTAPDMLEKTLVSGQNPQIGPKPPELLTRRLLAANEPVGYIFRTPLPLGNIREVSRVPFSRFLENAHPNLKAEQDKTLQGEPGSWKSLLRLYAVEDRHVRGFIGELLAPLPEFRALQRPSLRMRLQLTQGLHPWTFLPIELGIFAADVVKTLRDRRNPEA